ncbi:MAG TPA: hypothetical protein VFU09_13895, partial [Candidatus Udaeobacter sp.]|nr:hypothetical protein [Candidatus Udaeobacter sp.]
VKARTVNPNIFLTELKRRNVYRAAVAYGVVAWFLTQLTTQVFPFFEIPNSAVRFVVIACGRISNRECYSPGSTNLQPRCHWRFLVALQFL